MSTNAPVLLREADPVRMLPANQVRLVLQRHQVDWRLSQGRGLDDEGAMRLAIAATLPLVCTR